MDYCRQCDTCQRTTFCTQAPQGLARPLPIPHLPFTYIFTDFLSLPPEVRKEHRQEIIYDLVWTIVDRLSQYVNIIPFTKNAAAKILSPSFSTIYTQTGLCHKTYSLIQMLNSPAKRGKTSGKPSSLTNP